MGSPELYSTGRRGCPQSPVPGQRRTVLHTHSTHQPSLTAVDVLCTEDNKLERGEMVGGKRSRRERVKLNFNFGTGSKRVIIITNF